MGIHTNRIVCAHGDAENTGLACEHLLKKATPEYYWPSAHFRFFTGRATEFVLLCPECARQPEQGEPRWSTICDCCVQDIACGTRLGDIGGPEILIRDSGLTLTHRLVAIPKLTEPIAAASPRGSQANGSWLLLTERGELIVAERAESATCCVVARSRLNLEGGAPMLLCVSRDGRFAAAANTYGRRGVVVDLERRRVAMELVRGNYLNEHCKFPVAFVEHAGRQLVVHATDWNRLDISDPATGRLLTARGPPTFRRGEERPAHYLDYFQCGLSVSPDNEWIVSNGWVWHPVGLVKAWSLTRWLTENVWESEDGASKRNICGRDHYWDGPLCWIDNRTLAVWGLGESDILLVPGVRLFDVENGQETRFFAGPVGGFRKDTVCAEVKGRVSPHGAGSLVFDRWLYSWMEEKPFSIWDIGDGARLLAEPAFTPLGYDPSAKEFLSAAPDGTLRFTSVHEAS